MVPKMTNFELILATFLETFFGHRSWIGFGLHFGRPLAPFGLLLAPFWLPFGSLWLPLAPVWLPLAPVWLLLVPFWVPLAPFGSHFFHFSFLLAPFWLPFATFWLPSGATFAPFFTLATFHTFPTFRNEFVGTLAARTRR